MNIYDFDYLSIDGQKVSMSKYKGKVILIVNVASKCGLTHHYKGLQELQDKYKSKGFEVIGFPCNQFGGQEPLSEKEISEFCSLEYNINFDMSSKVDVRDTGTDDTADLYVRKGTAIPLFKFLTEQKGFVYDPNDGSRLGTIFKNLYKDTITDDQIKWNFTKFLIDQNGNVVKRFEPAVEPKDIEPDIKKLLG